MPGTSIKVNGERLRRTRHRKLLSLRELQEKTGVAANTISRLENGQAGAHGNTIRRLAEGLEVTVETILAD